MSSKFFGDPENYCALHAVEDIRSRAGKVRSSFVPSAPSDLETGSIVNWILQSREADYCSYEKLNIFISTFNVNGQSPEADLSSLLCSNITPDIYIFGFQELDLSQQTFLFDFTVREEEWSRIIYMNLCKVGSYFELKRVRMVGIFMLVYVIDHLYLNNVVKDVMVTMVGTGLLNRLGNKGAVAVRFRLYDSTFCFVNCHFASGVEELERRNQDYREISKMVFYPSVSFKKPLGIFDHDCLFWFGDMNYRLQNTCRQAVEAALSPEDTNSENSMKFLQFDQLTHMRQKGLIFQDFSEGSINFQPTYKYDKGIDKWDSSEKLRVPAWCDRILWCGDKVEQIVYESVREIRFSDHRAVRSVFSVDAKIIDQTKLKTVFEAALKESDRLENEWLPQVVLDNLEFVFNNAGFLEPQCQTLTVVNTGWVPVEFEFQKKPAQDVFSKPWVLVTPESHKIKVGDKCLVDIQLLIDKETVWAINEGRENLNDILVLHLKHSKDFFITITATFVGTCFGMSLEALAALDRPVRGVPTGSLIDLGSPSINNKMAPPSVPKELYRLVSHIHRNGLKQENLFAQAGSHAEFLAIRDALDTGYPEELPGDVNSAAEALLRFFDSLPDPLIPLSLQTACLQSASDYQACKQIIMRFPECHRATLAYLLTFLKEVLLNGADNGCTADTLGVILAPILFRFPARRGQLQQNLNIAGRFFVTLLLGAKQPTDR